MLWSQSGNRNTVEIGEAAVLSPRNLSVKRNAVDDENFHVGGTARLEQETKHAGFMDGTVNFLMISIYQQPRGRARFR